MKRKRKDVCVSPILDESPKRTKVQAQRKFAQNSGVHSPIITPIRDIDEMDHPDSSTLSEPVELLPMKRPNTEDFLTFLCFRGTPILPQNLQFFNTASIVADGQVHEIKGEHPKNGPIDITKCAGSSTEKPFVAFGVRKRADPIVISRQMERKRRHALAIQALRRKYQEQKMAKIRALTIGKLNEKTTNKTLVKTNTIQKTETVTKKNNTTLEKTKVVATKHVKVTQTLKTNNMKPKMCLRSFRGKFVQKELPFKNRRPLSEDDVKSVRTSKNSNKEEPKNRPQIKRRIILPSTIVTTIIKPKLRSTTVKKTVISRRKAQQRTSPELKNERLTRAKEKQVVKSLEVKKEVKVADSGKKLLKKNVSAKKNVVLKSTNKDIKKNVALEKHLDILVDSNQKVVATRDSKLTEITVKKIVNPTTTTVRRSSRSPKNKIEVTPKVVEKTKKKSPSKKKGDEEFTNKIQNLIDTALKVVDKTVEIKQEHEEEETATAATRPSRKTKLAAAIYMEILSHKLVNDNAIDDDTGSIDSFPELPNVKRTEQRENELKAQAKKSTEEEDSSSSDNETLQTKIKRNQKPIDDSSDESYRADVQVPKKKKLTRRQKAASTSSGVMEKNVDIILEAARVLDEDSSSSSDVNLKSLQTKQLKKKLQQSFSDSDEEPLSKLTKRSADEMKKPKTRRSAEVVESKPKRECTKRPSNYLPMLSSSEEDEEEYLPEEKPTIVVTALPPSIDLLGRKGKVNMSNEQIEQWLKDSAMAGSSVDKENDSMLKFGEQIPKVEESKSTKSPDRKWIFKKDKKEPMIINKNAFSPENECSVYAFGDENDEAVVSTPFRRPSRRPSSTATSRSEDDLSKLDDCHKFRKPPPSDSDDSRCFPIPQNPAKAKCAKKLKIPESFDDTKYKVPSSPSASSGSSTKLSKKGAQINKMQQSKLLWELDNPVLVEEFPKVNDPAQLVQAPVFHPTELEFQDPLDYIERIRARAEPFGICKIVPPTNFKPECKVSDDMRFTAYNQYVHKMLHRWGPNFKEFVAIKKYLATQSISLKTPPLIGGMEIDLPRLYQTVQSLGGLKEVIEKKKWSKVSELMKIPKSAQDRVTKLDDIYCKYLLPYDTLSPAEREKLFDEVETAWTKRTQQPKLDESTSSDCYDSDDNDADECTIKGKNMALNAFYRIARNTMAMYFKVSEPSASEVEQEFWKYVMQKQNHICVHSASIDCGTWGYGFPVAKTSPFAKHAWNLKVLSNNSGSVLRSLGPVMGVTVPTLHVGMVLSACCWYRDPHGLPWVEYLHTGGSKIWYGIPSGSCHVFRATMKKLVPTYCRDKELWLPSDTAMVPPGMLLEEKMSLCRTIQEPGEFMVVFPKVYTSSISTGYVVSESVYFAPLYWLETARSLFDELKNSCEPSMFSLDNLFISIANDGRCSTDVLRVTMPFVEELCSKELSNRKKLLSLGKLMEEKIPASEIAKKKKIQSVDGDFECEICRTNLYTSMVVDTDDDLIYCLDDALQVIEKDVKHVERFKFRYHLTESELEELPKKISLMIESKTVKKVPGKYAGLPTMLK